MNSGECMFLSKPLPVSKPILIASLIATCFTAPALAQEQKEGDLIPVIVTASRIEQSQRDAIASTSVITRERIEKSQAKDLPTLLQKEAGVGVVSNGGPGQTTSIYLRGSASHQVLILLDGVPIQDANSAGTPFEFQHMMADQIDRIEIVRGNVSAIYGSGAMGGVIQIFTKKGDSTPTATLSAEYGTNSTVKLNAGASGKVDGTKYAFSVTRYKTNGFSATDSTQRSWASGDKDGTRDIAFSGALSHEWSPGNEIGIRLYGFDAKTQYDSNPTGKDWIEARQTTIAAFTKNRLTEDWTSTLTASHTSMKRNYYYSDATIPKGYYDPVYPSNKTGYYRNETSMLQSFNEIALSSDWILTVGADGQHEKAEIESFNYSKWAYGKQYEVSRNNYDVFAGLNGRLGNHSLQANIRYDHVKDVGSDTTGYLGYGYDLTKNWKLVASASTAFKAPTLYQLYDPQYGNTKLDPEKSVSYEGGIQYSNSNTLVRATLFETKVHDQFGSDSKWRYINIHRVKNKGFELNGQTQVFGFDINGNLTLQDPENRDTGKAVARQAKKLASLGISKSIGDWYIGGDVHYERERFDDNNNKQKLGSFALVNFQVRYQLTKEFEVFGRVDNLFDKEYQTAYGYNQWGRAFFGGVNWKM